MNNAIYYHLFDSIINTYLIEQCSMDPQTSTAIGLVVESHCHVCLSLFLQLIPLYDISFKFFAPVSFPEILELGLRVNKIGKSSVEYEVGVFVKGNETPTAVGGYTHVFVGSKSRKSVPLTEKVKRGLEMVYKKPIGVAKL